MGLDLPDTSVDNLHLPPCISAGVSSNRVGLGLFFFLKNITLVTAARVKGEGRRCSALIPGQLGMGMPSFRTGPDII